MERQHKRWNGNGSRMDNENHGKYIMHMCTDYTCTLLCAHGARSVKATTHCPNQKALPGLLCSDFSQNFCEGVWHLA